MLVTLDMFSGRPNPTWNLSEAEQRQVLDRVRGRTLAQVEVPDSRLGYRGIVIDPSEDSIAEIPQGFRIESFSGAGLTTKGQLSPDEEKEIAQFLLEAARAAVPDDVRQLVTEERQRLSLAPLPGDPPLPDPPDPIPPATCQLVPTAFSPNVWNTYPNVYWNNCYNYAASRQTNTFAQPGRAAGQMYTALTCADVGAAASRDKCKATCNGPSKKVALVIWPNVDFHFYRKHSEGFWAHKPGGTPARNTDNLNRVINGTTLTPANCARGPYSVFCGYRYAPKDIVVS